MLRVPFDHAEMDYIHHCEVDPLFAAKQSDEPDYYTNKVWAHLGNNKLHDLAILTKGGIESLSPHF